MKLFKYFLIFVVPLLFLSLVGSFVIKLFTLKKSTAKKQNHEFVIDNKNIKNKDTNNYIYTIIIDPSETSLDFCFELAKKFRETGVNVYLTKNSDYEIGQEEKFEILYNIKASLYLHIDIVKNENFKDTIISLNNKLKNAGQVNFIPNEVEKSKKTIFIEDSVIDSLSFYFSISKDNILKKYSETIDVPIDIASIIFSFKNKKNLNIEDKIIKSIIMGLSSKYKG